MRTTKPQSQGLTPWQEEQKAQLTPKLPDGLSDTARTLFLKAVSKITFAPHELGGLSVSYESLSKDELFAIGITGTDAFPIFTPENVKEKLKAIQPRIENSILAGATIIQPASELAAQKRLRELERRKVLVTQHGEKFKVPEPGSLSPQAKYIHNLAQDNRTFSAKELQNIADRQVIGEMGHDAFRDHVTAARKIYPKEKKPRRKSILRD